MERGFSFVAGEVGLTTKGREGVAAGFGGVGGVDVVQAAEGAAVRHQDYQGHERPEGDQNVWLIQAYLVDEKPDENSKCSYP